MLFSGKVAGISGILNGLLTPKKGDFLWRLFFIIGMASSILLLSPFSIELPELSDQPLVFIIAGLLVGFGTRLGNGCTSGHGIVGIGRLSTRSIIATCLFIGVAAFFVFLRLHVGV